MTFRSHDFDRAGPSKEGASSRGFTLLEVMMAVFVMAIVVTTSITTLQRGLQALDTARNLSYAGQIMQSEFERVRLLNWATVSAYSSTPTAITIPAAFTNITDVSNRFTISRTATLVHTGMMQITLSITWTNYDGHAVTRSYTTYYGQGGLYDYIIP